ncbi:MAG: S46 family peptidase [Pyrinomonadaceae bacterium]|nr:S46 family peptidase [Pyrinomonadaceae bacterium]
MRLKLNIFSTYILMCAVILSSVSFAFAIPDEGMFTPDQIGKLPLAGKGLKIKPSEIYNPNGVDLADAIMRVNIAGGGFGTGEFVSPNGLILTNHHVGYDALVKASTPANNYAMNGYKADSTANELTATGYTLLLTSRVENVTAQITTGIEDLTGAARKQAVEKKIEALQTQEQSKAVKETNIRVQELNSGLFYYLYETTLIKDVRVVYAPPSNIGIFGGDPDNFEWTRHTGDFTFLRAYVAPDGTSAEYSSANVPFKPKKFLTVSLNGVRENEFVMVMGYPGGTTRYRESQSVLFSQNVNFPFLAGYFRAFANAYVKAGEDDEAKTIKFKGDIQSFNNARKIYEGNNAALRRADFIAEKRNEELKFASWIAGSPARQTKYGAVLTSLQRNSDTFYRTGKRDVILRRLPSGATPTFQEIYTAITTVQQGKPIPQTKVAEIEAVYKDREPVVEREMLKFLFNAAADLPADQTFQPVENLFNRFQGKERRLAEETFAESIAEKDFDTAQKVVALYSLPFADLQKKYPNIVNFVTALAQERAAITERTTKFNSEIDGLRLLYQQGMAEMEKSNPYPDANASLRFSYGSVRGYNPREAVTYTPFTTLKGMIEKDTGEDPFEVPQKIKDLQRAKDFGRYGVGDSVPVNFLATTDIIGGNSGSPILNGLGEQVGIVFDGNFEGLANDLFYNDSRGRTIAVDIRYVLFVTEKVGNAGWILDEMAIKGKTPVRAKRATAE